MEVVIWVFFRLLGVALAGAYLYYVKLPNKRAFVLSAVVAAVFTCAAYFMLLGLSPVMGWSVLVLGPLANGLLFVLFYYWAANRPTGDTAHPLEPGKAGGSAMPGFVALTLRWASILVGLEVVALFALLLEGVICILMALNAPGA